MERATLNLFKDLADVRQVKFYLLIPAFRAYLRVRRGGLYSSWKAQETLGGPPWPARPSSIDRQHWHHAHPLPSPPSHVDHSTGHKWTSIEQSTDATGMLVEKIFTCVTEASIVDFGRPWSLVLLLVIV